MGTDPKSCVVLDLDEDKARQLYRRIVNSRDAVARALCQENLGEAGFYMGWLDACLTELAAACPSRIKPGPSSSLYDSAVAAPDHRGLLFGDEQKVDEARREARQSGLMGMAVGAGVGMVQNVGGGDKP